MKTVWRRMQPLTLKNRAPLQASICSALWILCREPDRIHTGLDWDTFTGPLMRKICLFCYFTFRSQGLWEEGKESPIEYSSLVVLDKNLPGCEPKSNWKHNKRSRTVEMNAVLAFINHVLYYAPHSLWASCFGFSEMKAIPKGVRVEIESKTVQRWSEPGSKMSRFYQLNRLSWSEAAVSGCVMQPAKAFAQGNRWKSCYHRRSFPHVCTVFPNSASISNGVESNDWYTCQAEYMSG